MTVTRFAPSPTGYLHIGNMRAALMNYLIARKTQGTFILRIDDTDPERSKEEYVDQIKRDLEWLGLTWDRIERQSERLDRYHAAADKLRDMGRFYECFETPTELDLKRKKQLNMGKPPVYDRAARGLSDAEKDALRAERGSGHWRFLLDHERINWSDGILGDLSIDAASVSDPVLIRADGQFLYTLASVVDDTEMGITHVVRGSDHVTNTATQIQMIQALGGNVPEFAHHSLLTGPQGEALSKRLGTLALKDMRENGIEPEAIISHMARLGQANLSNCVRHWTRLRIILICRPLALHQPNLTRRICILDRAFVTRSTLGGYPNRLGRRGRICGFGRRLLGRCARKHHHTQRYRSVVDPDQSKRRSSDRRGRPRICCNRNGYAPRLAI